MTEVDRIAGEFGQAVKGDPWHGPSLTAALEGVTAEIAASRPHATVHTIWEITLHLAAWEGAVTRRLKSGIASFHPKVTGPRCSIRARTGGTRLWPCWSNDTRNFRTQYKASPMTGWTSWLENSAIHRLAEA
jgi:hypothetical protein